MSTRSDSSAALRFKQKQIRIRQETDQALKQIFQAESVHMQKVHSPTLQQGFHLLREFTMRPASKRVRAMLVYLGYESTGKRAPKKLAQLAAVIEIVHNYLLILDDIADRDEFRRGGSTVHEAFRKTIPGSRADKHHRGVSMAMFTGNYASLLAFRYLMLMRWPAQKLQEAIVYLLKSLQHETYVGEFMDIEQSWLHRTNKNVITTIAELKTASYTFSLPLTMGAILAGANSATRRDLQHYAIPVGVGFQLADDLLGFTPQRHSGKPSNDIREGKVTEIILRARKKLKQRDRQNLDALFAKSVRTQTEIKEVRRIIGKTKALEEVQSMANAQAEKAKQVLQKSRHIDADCASMLSVLADISVYRTA
ncbi:MAG: polyprenyl synthetase family protein [Candidatus Nomurabacteria bacterium]|nr:MAG: polyprenyl synthetase family protein [Candidatus Nomurabacteria bacterium]